MIKDNIGADPKLMELSANAKVNESIDATNLAELMDAEKQSEYRREYLKHLRLRACPGCGESSDVF